MERRTLIEMLDYCYNNKIKYFCDFVDYALEHEYGWFELLINNNVVGTLICNYIESQKTKEQEEAL